MLIAYMRLNNKLRSYICKTYVNFRVNIDTDVDAKKLKSLLHQFDLIEHVNVPKCCVWYDWPSALISYIGIIIWYQRQGFGLVPILSNRSHSKSSDQEINIWAARVEIWCATGVRSGPIIFTIYTTPLGQLIRRHGLTFHLYADDTQLYLGFKPSEPSSIVNNISRLEKYVDDIWAWMKLNLLKLNDDKTELLVIISRPRTSQSLRISIKVGDQYISPSEEPPWSYFWFYVQPERPCF